MKDFRKLVVGLLLASVLLQPLGLVTPVLAETVEMEYSDPNHLHAPKVVNGVTYEYDANGNLVNDRERKIGWNQDNKPIRITKGDQVVEFFYDASGGRILKKSFLASNPNDVDTTIYVSGSYQKSVVDGVETTTKYYFANGRVAVRNTPSGGTPTLTYLHQDHLGSTVLATGSDSQPLSDTRLAYFPYGEVSTGQGVNVSTNYLFTDQEKDPESALYNYNARLYNPTTGAFISADSVGGGNRYSYAENSPMVFTDPTGHDIWDVVRELWGRTDLSLLDLLAFSPNVWAPGASEAIGAELQEQTADYYEPLFTANIGGESFPGPSRFEVMMAASYPMVQVSPAASVVSSIRWPTRAERKGAYVARIKAEAESYGMTVTEGAPPGQRAAAGCVKTLGSEGTEIQPGTQIWDVEVVTGKNIGVTAHELDPTAGHAGQITGNYWAGASDATLGEPVSWGRMGYEVKASYAGAKAAAQYGTTFGDLLGGSANVANISMELTGGMTVYRAAGGGVLGAGAMYGYYYSLYRLATSGGGGSGGGGPKGR